jgi:raffinose/stachyose/melibiose transport system substrate-binding protein
LPQSIVDYEAGKKTQNREGSMRLNGNLIRRSVANFTGALGVAALVGTATNAGFAQGVQAEIVMWNIPLSESYTKFWTTYVENFNSSHPDINVTYEEFDTETLKTKIRAALLAGTEPDIWFFFPGEFTTLNYREGKVRAIDDILPVSEYTDEGLRRCSDGDTVICLPLFMAPSALYYNKALFAEAGVDPSKWANPDRPTLDEFNAAIDALKAAGIEPLAVGNSGKWPFMHYYWAAQNRYGGTEALNDAVLGQNGGSYEEESFIRAGRFVQDLANREALSSGFNGLPSSEMYALFHQGDAAMIYMGPWIIAITEGNAAEGFEYDLFDFPSVSDGNQNSQTDMMAGLDALFVSSSTKHPEAVGTFLAGFSQPDTARRFMIETNNMSTVKGILEDVVQSGDANEKLARLAEFLSKASHTYQWWDWLLPPAVAEEMLNVSQPLSVGDITPEEAAARLERVARP